MFNIHEGRLARLTKLNSREHIFMEAVENEESGIKPNVNSDTIGYTTASFINHEFSERLFKFGKYDHRPQLHQFSRSSSKNAKLLIEWNKWSSHMCDTRIILHVIKGVKENCIQVNTRPLSLSTPFVYTYPQVINAFCEELKSWSKMLEI